MKSYGEELHSVLRSCMENNPHGSPYRMCVFTQLEENKNLVFWVGDFNEREGCVVHVKKLPNSFSVKAAEGDKIWCVCIDGCLIKNQGSNSPARCDNLVFSENTFYFVEAKLKVSARWEGILHEIDQAIEKQIKNTKDILLRQINDYGETFSQKDIRVAIPFSGSNQSVPRRKAQLLEQLRVKTQKTLKVPIKKFSLDETIEFTTS